MISAKGFISLSHNFLYYKGKEMKTAMMRVQELNKIMYAAIK